MVMTTVMFYVCGSGGIALSPPVSLLGETLEDAKTVNPVDAKEA